MHVHSACTAAGVVNCSLQALWRTPEWCWLMLGRELLESWRNKLSEFFLPHIPKDKIFFRQLRSPGAKQHPGKALIVLITQQKGNLYIINLSAIEQLQHVHSTLQRLGQPTCASTSEDQQCECRMQLMLYEMSRLPQCRGMQAIMMRRVAKLLHA